MCKRTDSDINDRRLQQVTLQELGTRCYIASEWWPNGAY